MVNDDEVSAVKAMMAAVVAAR
jgi:hypothetical protein